MFTDATTRFSTKAEVYARARPRYPDSVVTFLQQHHVIQPGSIIADIGSGTGLSALPFLHAGYSVIGIEPNDPMHAEGDTFLKTYTNFQSVKGTATATTLPAQSVNVAMAAQAFHWFDLDATRTEMQRILKPPGWFVAMWNHRNHNASPLHQGYEAILRKYCPEYHKLAELYRSPERSAHFFINGYHDATLPNPQQLNWEYFDARIQSASYIPKPTDANYAPFMNEMKQLFDANAIDGKVQFDLEVWIHWGRIAV
ncbi:MAG: class I SAM-dependent methyltransferase [Planctomycetia bacterium]|nr:class I SAM-dependent methyltransferase [Planctomycetia bacterium]